MMLPRIDRAGTSVRKRARQSVTIVKKNDPPGTWARLQFGIGASYYIPKGRDTRPYVTVAGESFVGYQLTDQEMRPE